MKNNYLLVVLLILTVFLTFDFKADPCYQQYNTAANAAYNTYQTDVANCSNNTWVTKQRCAQEALKYYNQSLDRAGASYDTCVGS